LPDLLYFCKIAGLKATKKNINEILASQIVRKHLKQVALLLDLNLPSFFGAKFVNLVRKITHSEI